MEVEVAEVIEATETRRMMVHKEEAAVTEAVAVETRKMLKRLKVRRPKLGSVEEGVDEETEGEEVVEGVAEVDAVVERLSPPQLQTKPQPKKPRLRRKIRLKLSPRLRRLARLPKSSNLSSQSRR